MKEETKSLYAMAQASRAAQRVLGNSPATKRTAALERVATLLGDRQQQILAANHADIEAAQAEGVAAPLLSRLALSVPKLETLRDGLRTLAVAPDPVGRVLRRTELDDGLQLTKVMSPIGVVLVVFESRPDAVIQIGGLTIRTGNGVVLKGGSEARHSNAALVGCLRDALLDCGLAPDGVAHVEDRAAVQSCCRWMT